MKKIVRQFAELTIVVCGAALLLPACSSLSLQQVDFGWPVESVLRVKEDNSITEGRHAMAFNVAVLADAEFENPNALKGKNLRLLRSTDGMYYITGEGFKYVYVFAPDASELKLHRRFEVSSTGLQKPAFNQRDPYVELIDGSSLRILMTSDDLLEEQDLRAEGLR